LECLWIKTGLLQCGNALLVNKGNKMDAFVVFDEKDNIKAIFDNYKEAWDLAEKEDLNLDRFSTGILSFEEFCALAQSGIQ
jgi:hypothetical protein